MKHLPLLATLIASAALIASPTFAEHHEGAGKEQKKGKMFERLDTNADGSISKAEFLAQSEARFKKMDADGDGKISQEEAKNHRQEMREKRQEKREARQDMREQKAAQ